MTLVSYFKKLTAAQSRRLKPRNGVNWYNGDYYTTASCTIDVRRLEAYRIQRRLLYNA